MSEINENYKNNKVINGNLTLHGNIQCSSINGNNIAPAYPDTKLPKFPYVPVIKTDGLIELGKYIDFHEVNSEQDYDARIYYDNKQLISTTNFIAPNIGLDNKTRLTNLENNKSDKTHTHTEINNNLNINGTSLLLKKWDETNGAYIGFDAAQDKCGIHYNENNKQQGMSIYVGDEGNECLKCCKIDSGYNVREGTEIILLDGNNNQRFNNVTCNAIITKDLAVDNITCNNGVSITKDLAVGGILKFNNSDNYKYIQFSGGTDTARIGYNQYSPNKGYIELAIFDDGDEEIIARKYRGSAINAEAKLLDASGNTSFPGKLDVGGFTDKMKLLILNVVYPVGSIWISAVKLDLSTMFPGTTWKLIDNRYLFSVDEKHSAGSVGGNNYITQDNIKLKNYNGSWTGEYWGMFRNIDKSTGIIGHGAFNQLHFLDKYNYSYPASGPLTIDFNVGVSDPIPYYPPYYSVYAYQRLT